MTSPSSSLLHPWPRQLLFHVAAMINSRAVRELLGFSYEECVRSRVPPCTITTIKALPALNRVLHWRTREPQELFVYDSTRNLTIYLECSWYMKYEFSVVTHITLIATKEKLEWVVKPGSEERTLWYNQGHIRIFGDETVGTFSYYTESMPDLIVS